MCIYIYIYIHTYIHTQYDTHVIATLIYRAAIAYAQSPY